MLYQHANLNLRHLIFWATKKDKSENFWRVQFFALITTSDLHFYHFYNLEYNVLRVEMFHIDRINHCLHLESFFRYFWNLKMSFPIFLNELHVAQATKRLTPNPSSIVARLCVEETLQMLLLVRSRQPQIFWTFFYYKGEVLLTYKCDVLLTEQIWSLHWWKQAL